MTALGGLQLLFLHTAHGTPKIFICCIVWAIIRFGDKKIVGKSRRLYSGRPVVAGATLTVRRAIDIHSRICKIRKSETLIVIIVG